MDVVFFGDSITAGCRAPLGQGWVEQLAARLPEITAHNAGVHGETSQDALRRVDKDALRRVDKDALRRVDKDAIRRVDKTALGRGENSVEGEQPAVVYIQFGLNDASWWCRQAGRSWVKEADYIATMREMVRRCREGGIQTVIVATNHPVLDSTPPATDDTPTYSGTVRQYNVALRAAFADGPEMLVDMEAVFDAHSDLKSLLDADGLHLSPQGNALYAETVEGVFRKNFAFLA